VKVNNPILDVTKPIYIENKNQFIRIVNILNKKGYIWKYSRKKLNYYIFPNYPVYLYCESNFDVYHMSTLHKDFKR
jgi:hypothetical protein